MSEQSVGFEIQPVIEQKPFKNQAVQNFFEEWCGINDHIEPVFVDRKTWEEKESILEESGDDKKNLYIPRDLQLWEMVRVMEAVDEDTFKDKPERQYEAKQKMINLGETFKDTGIYIAQRLGVINEGKGIAKKLAEQLFNYGESLVTGEKADKPKTVEDISGMELTNKETQNVDRLLAGDKLYESREMRIKREMRGRIANRGSFYEEERQRTLTQFFRVSQKAFELQERSRRGELKKVGNGLEPWLSDVSTHEGFIGKVEKKLTQEIEKPRAELGESIFRRGMDLLAKYMPFDKLPKEITRNYLHWKNGEKTLSEALKTDDLRKQLDLVRKLGNKADISEMERNITNMIQDIVSSFKYGINASNPSEMIVNQEVNCAGASTLGGAEMQEVTLNYLVVSMPRHSILLLVTTDGQVEWRDMLHPENKLTLKDENIIGQKDNGKLLTVADIVAFSKDPKPEGINFIFKSGEYQRSMSVFGPEYGQKLAVLNNLAIILEESVSKEKGSKKYFETLNNIVELYRETIRLNPKDAFIYSNLGICLYRLGNFEEAIRMFREGIKIDPNSSDNYYTLAACFFKLKQYKEAVEVYERFVEVADSKRYKEEIEGAKSFIEKYKNR